MRTHGELTITVFLTSLVAAVGVLWVGGCMKVPSHKPSAQRDVRAIRTWTMANVQEMTISLAVPKSSRRQTLVLRRDRDNDAAWMRRILSSIKRITVADHGRRVGTFDQISVTFSKGGSTLWLHLEPADAPVVSEWLRSDDLARVVYELYAERGTEPPR